MARRNDLGVRNQIFGADRCHASENFQPSVTHMSSSYNLRKGRILAVVGFKRLQFMLFQIKAKFLN